MPDLILWNPKTKTVKFSEVKSENDRLSEVQKAWLAYMSQNEIQCEVCLVNWDTDGREDIEVIEVFREENFRKGLLPSKGKGSKQLIKL